MLINQGCAVATKAGSVAVVMPSTAVDATAKSAAESFMRMFKTQTDNQEEASDEKASHQSSSASSSVKK